MTVVLITGISGTGVGSFVNDAIQIGKDRFHTDFNLIQLGRRMWELDVGKGALSYEQWEATILNRLAVLPYLRRVAFDSAVHEVRKDKDRIHLILSKATFWHHKTIIPGFDQTRLNQLDFDYLVTIVNDVIDVWSELRNSHQERWSSLSPIDVLEWREIETFFTEQMARILGDEDLPIPFYVLAIRYGPRSLVRLLLKPKSKKVYRSYPITFVKARPEVQREADRLGDHLQKTAIVFNPRGIQDYDRLRDLKKEYRKWCKQKRFAFSATDWQQIVQHVSQQTVSRDHRLIEQSNYIVVYYPELKYYTKKGSKHHLTRLVPFSSGVLDEMHYATERGKEVLLFWNSKQDSGPFLSSIHTKKFKSVDALLEFAAAMNTRQAPNHCSR